MENQKMILGEFVFGKRWTPLKWIAIIPSLVAFIFLDHAFETPDYWVRFHI
jgi:hypothetical protein